MLRINNPQNTRSCTHANYVTLLLISNVYRTLCFWGSLIWSVQSCQINSLQIIWISKVQFIFIHSVHCYRFAITCLSLLPLGVCKQHLLGSAPLTKWTNIAGSALDHIELTYHDVTVFAIRDFKTLEVLKNYFLW